MGGVATLSKGGAVEDMSTTLSEKEDLSRIKGIEAIVSTGTFRSQYHDSAKSLHIDLPRVICERPLFMCCLLDQGTTHKCHFPIRLPHFLSNRETTLMGGPLVC